MMKVHEPPKLATASAMRSPKVASSSITSLGLRAGAHPHQLLRGMELPPQHGRACPCRRAACAESASGCRCGRPRADASPRARPRVGLMRRLVEHRGEAEELAAAPARSTTTSWLILVDGRHADRAGNHDVGRSARHRRSCRCAGVGQTSSPRPGREHRELVVVQQGEQRNSNT